ncbi:FAD-binding oxidoreductase [Glaciihabitans sp. UYNi722]|uniref:FAD-binding oxidoreductase n=1 Tax=Glaciihabitans sp. UYNi722 TaxID=3156344 RepID=UPI00339521FE
MSTDTIPIRFTDFPPTFRGPTLRPGDHDYPEARQIWNMRRDDELPALIVQPLDVDDVVTAMKYAASHNIPVAVCGGGHGIDGNAMPEGALVVDTAKLQDVTIDPSTNRVTIQSGVKLGRMDAATQEYGLIVPAGVVSDTGAAGLTLGGGIGHNARRFGATVDNLISIELVTADGSAITASADSNAELFWGMKGAGHNLGIATSLTYQGHEVGPKVVSGLIIFSADDAPRIFDGIDSVMADAPRSLSCNFLVLLAPPLPGLPDFIVGTPILVALVVYTGSVESYPAAISGLIGLASPMADMVAPSTWLEANSIVDAFEPPGRRQYMVGGYLSGLNGDIARKAVAAITNSPRPKSPLPSCLITFPVLGGALLDADEDSAAFSRIGAQWLLEVASEWDDGSDDSEYSPWVDVTIAEFSTDLATNAYTNLTADRGPEWLRGAYGSQDKWDRIVELKRVWDPNNRFAYNKNVTRAVESA